MIMDKMAFFEKVQVSQLYQRLSEYYPEKQANAS